MFGTFRHSSSLALSTEKLKKVHVMIVLRCFFTYLYNVRLIEENVFFDIMYIK